jgi:hypothetical protein
MARNVRRPLETSYDTIRTRCIVTTAVTPRPMPTMNISAWRVQDGRSTGQSVLTAPPRASHRRSASREQAAAAR